MPRSSRWDDQERFRRRPHPRYTSRPGRLIDPRALRLLAIHELERQERDELR